MYEFPINRRLIEHSCMCIFIIANSETSLFYGRVP